MTPRLSSSTKWTPFPAEYVNQIKEVFSENFKTQLAGGRLIIEGRIYPQEILLRVGYLENGRLLQANFETSIDYEQKNEDILERIYNSLDVTASMMDEYFEVENATENFPRIWQDCKFKGQKLYIQYTTVNSDLEAQADLLLGAEALALLNEETPENLPLAALIPESDASPDHHHIHDENCEHLH